LPLNLTPFSRFLKHPAAFWLPVVLVAAGYVLLKPLQLLSFESRLLDTGIYHNLVWRLSEGLGSWSDVLGRDHFGEHFNPIVLLLAAVYWLWPSAHVLLLAQGLAAGATVITLAHYARLIQQHPAPTPTQSQSIRTTRPSWLPWLWIAWALAALSYRPLQAAWFGDFQPIVLGMPMVVFALIAMHQGQNKRLLFWALLLLTTREAAPLTLLGLALVAGLQYKRWKPAAVLAGLGLIAAIAAFQFVMPHFRGPQDWHQTGRVGPFNDWPSKSKYLLLCVLPLAFLPLLGWRITIGCLPGLLLNLSTDTGNQYSMAHHYDAQLGVFLLAGSAVGLARLTAWLQARSHTSAGQATKRPPRAVYLGLGVWGLWITACSGPNLISAFDRWKPVPDDTALARAIEQVMAQHPDAQWAADDVIGPSLCASQYFVAIKVDRRAVTDGSYPYIPRLQGNQVIVLAKRSWDHKEHRAVLMASSRADLLVDNQELTVLQWTPQQQPDSD